MTRTSAISFQYRSSHFQKRWWHCFSLFAWSSSVIRVCLTMLEEGGFSELQRVTGLLSHGQLWTLGLTLSPFQDDDIISTKRYVHSFLKPEVWTKLSMSHFTRENKTFVLAHSISIATGLYLGYRMLQSLLVHVSNFWALKTLGCWDMWYWL